MSFFVIRSFAYDFNIDLPSQLSTECFYIIRFSALIKKGCKVTINSTLLNNAYLPDYSIVKYLLSLSAFQKK